MTTFKDRCRTYDRVTRRPFEEQEGGSVSIYLARVLPPGSLRLSSPSSAGLTLRKPEHDPSQRSLHRRIRQIQPWEVGDQILCRPDIGSRGALFETRVDGSDEREEGRFGHVRGERRWVREQEGRGSGGGVQRWEEVGESGWGSGSGVNFDIGRVG